MSGTQAPMPAIAADGFDAPIPDADGSFDERAGSISNSPKSGLGRWRRPLGLLLLFATVFLWTASNFLQSTIFADNTFSKPFFVTYVNTAFFTLPLAPILAWRLYRHPQSVREWGDEIRGTWRGRYALLKRADADGSVYTDSPRSRGRRQSLNASQELLLGEPTEDNGTMSYKSSILSELKAEEALSIPEIAKLSLEFSLVWYLSNYFVAACLEYTTVASSTLINNTSSIFTLIFGTMLGVERFTVKKGLAVVASMVGIILICSIDLFGNNTDDEHRGDFPKKSAREMAIGDVLAFASAVMYGFYAVFMKKRVGSESRVNMPVFFGFVGLFNVVLLWPGFIILHFTKVEPFQLPPTGRVVGIILSNSAASLISDFFWAYAVLLTSPIVVTVGLSMTIPLSLIGQIVLNSQTAPVLYWVGACIMLISFIFVNLDERDKKEEQAVKLPGSPAQRARQGGLN